MKHLKELAKAVQPVNINSDITLKEYTIKQYVAIIMD